MVDREFYVEYNVKYCCLKTKQLKTERRSSYIKYGTGIPMGFLSSFTGGLALCHHAIVQTAASIIGASCRGNLFLDYAVLGDDIAIFNEDIAKIYRWIVEDQLNMTISWQKTIIAPASAEFAKMIVCQGSIVTPCP